MINVTSLSAYDLSQKLHSGEISSLDLCKAYLDRIKKFEKDVQAWQFLIITQIIIFLLGWPLEWTEILIIFVPIFLPLLEIFDVNPYFLAMLIALNLQTSFLTPPMAKSAYYLKGVQAKNVELMEIFRGIMPFLGIVIFAMFLMYLFPGIALWLPDTLFAN